MHSQTHITSQGLYVVRMMDFPHWMSACRCWFSTKRDQSFCLKTLTNWSFQIFVFCFVLFYDFNDDECHHYMSLFYDLTGGVRIHVTLILKDHTAVFVCFTQISTVYTALCKLFSEPHHGGLWCLTFTFVPYRQQFIFTKINLHSV